MGQSVIIVELTWLFICLLPPCWHYFSDTESSFYLSHLLIVTRTLLIFSITVVKCQWFLYFDDYHDQGPVRSSIHSTLWTYLHFMLNLSQLLLGVGCLDLIRIYQLAKDTSLFPDEPEEAKYPNEAAGGGGLTSALSPSAFPDILRDDRRELGPHHDLVLIYVKKYFLIVAANVFLWNAAIKYVTSRPGGNECTLQWAFGS